MATLLIADDEHTIRDYLKRIAATMGHNCIEAPDGKQALEQFQSNTVDLVILDVQMPGLDGISLLHQIKAIDPNAVVIIMTGFPSAEDIINTIEDDGYTYISKPLNLEKMKDLIVHGLDHRQKLIGEES